MDVSKVETIRPGFDLFVLVEFGVFPNRVIQKSE